MEMENCFCEDKKNAFTKTKITGTGAVNTSFSIVIFGATGDLTKRKLIPALFNLFRDKLLSNNFYITGFARREKTDGKFREEMEKMSEKILHSEKGFEKSNWHNFEERLFYLSGNFNDPESYKNLKKFLREKDKEYELENNRIFYLACDPSFFSEIIEKLFEAGLINRPNDKNWTRVVIEKPFGHNLKTAGELNSKLANYLDESQIYRIDHYLGKETVQNILSFRFGNAIFEPLFNNNYVDHVQITVAESLGMEGGRGAYYDSSGAIRDIIQNHLLQLIALVAEEPPYSFEAKAIRDEKVKIFKSIRPYTPCCVKKKIIRAQYEGGIIDNEAIKGYREEQGVNPDSTTETYVAMELYIDNWRWSGVPFYIRTGKRLKNKLTEIAVQFKTPPLNFFKTVECDGDVCEIIREEPNVIIFQVQPNESISLTFSAKRPGPDFLIQPVTMNFGYKSTFHKPLAEAYERLILDVIKGDSTLFPRFDEIEATWEIIDPILTCWEEEKAGSILTYKPGSQGPEESSRLFCNCEGRWREL